MSANYDLNSSLPAHQIEDYEHNNQQTSTPYDHLTANHDTSYAGTATTTGNGHNGNGHNGHNNHDTHAGYQSFKELDTRGGLNNNEDHHMMDDDNKSVLSKLLERSKLISEVLEATYAKPTSYVKYARQEQQEGIDDDLASVMMQNEFETGHRVKFGTWDGVCARCLLNIFGVIMYLRVGFIVAESGIYEAVAIIVIASAVTLITTLSMSALCTNGVVLGGGAYYFISRVMGPSVGGSVGLVFSVGNMFAVSLYIIGFAETLAQHIMDETTGYQMFDEQNDIRIWSNVLLVLTFILAIIGMSIVIKTQLFLLLLIMVSVIFFFVGSVYKTYYVDIAIPTPSPTDAPTDSIFSMFDVFGLSSTIPSDRVEVIFGVSGWTNGNFEENLYSDYDKQYDFWRVFAIFFPAVTGIMAGANISGDLKRPHIDIPKGTLWSIAISTVTYIGLAVVVGAVVIRDAGDGENGLKNDNLIMAKICSWSYLVLIGIYAATLSSAIEALVGAPRILQAICFDLAKDCFPFLQCFEKENKAGDPIRGYILTCVVTFLCNLTGELNAVAEMISQFFMFTYAVMNFCVFWIEVKGDIGKDAWDPSFKYYNKWLSLFGAIACFGSMFVMNYMYAGPAMFITLLLYLWIEYKDPKTTYKPIKRLYIFESLCPFSCCKRMGRKKTMQMKFEDDDDFEQNTELMDRLK